MNILVLASGSAGNCYIVSDGHSKIMLEAGTTSGHLHTSLKGKTKDINACFITHEHKDHSRAGSYLSKLMAIYTTEGTREACSWNGYTYWAFKRNGKLYHPVRIGTFIILPFRVEHDAAEPVGFLIKSAETKECLLFATDTARIPYNFKNLNYIMIEANYDDSILRTSDLSVAQKSRIRSSHMSITTCISYLKTQDLSKCKKILLMHLSDRHADADNFVKRVETATGIPTYVAEVTENGKPQNV